MSCCIRVEENASTCSLGYEFKSKDPGDQVEPRQIPAPRDRIAADERELAQPELDGYKKFREWAGAPKIEEPFDKLSASVQAMRLWATSLPQSNVTDYNPYMAEETFLLFADRIRTPHPLGDRPIVILSRQSDDQERMQKQKKLLQLSSKSAFAESHFPIHEVQIAEPALVVRAIQAVQEAIKTGNPPTLP